MPATDVRAELADLKKRIDDVEREGRANAGSLAVAIRKTRLQLVSAELRSSVEKLSPPTSLLPWKPRTGDIARPAIDDSLIDRLRKGEQVSGTLGNTEPVIGQANLLPNPLLEHSIGVAIGAVAARAMPAWSAHYVLNSGIAPPVFVDDLYQRGDANDNPLNSTIVAVGTSNSANNYDLDIYLYPTVPFTAVGVDPLPYLVASGRVTSLGAAPDPNFPTVRARIELWNNTTATVVAASDWLTDGDLAGGDLRQLVASLGGSPGADGYFWQLRVNIIKTGGAIGTQLCFGEPMLHYAYSPDPLPFSPLIAGWFPSEIVATYGNNAFPSFSFDGSQGLRLGGGTSTYDVRLDRVAAGELEFDTNGQAVATLLRLEATAGQRVVEDLRVAGDTGVRLRLTGDATAVGIELGSGVGARDWQLLRTAANVAQVGAGDTLDVLGALQLGGVGVSVIGHGAADHANLTRTAMFLPSWATLDGATLVNVGASPNLSQAINYADAAAQGAFWWWVLPQDYDSGVISIQPLWTPSASVAGTPAVRWTVTAKSVVTGTDVTAAGTTTNFTGLAAARTVNIAVTESAQSTGVTPTAGARMLIRLGRLGADAADTLTAAARLYGLLVSYTANQ